jgi:hypothetical protein
MDYKTFKESQSKEFNEFTYIFFAFNNEQFNEGMKRLNLKNTSEVVSIGHGGYLPKNKVKDFKDLLDKQKNDLKNFKKDQKALVDAILYELNNHEYCVTGSIESVLDVLGLDRVEHGEAIKKAIKLYNVNN